METDENPGRRTNSSRREVTDGHSSKSNHSRSQKQRKSFECLQEGCKKSYKRAEHLHRHQLNHTPKQIYYCKFLGCTRNFVREDLSKRHEGRHTKPKKPEKPKIICEFPECRRTFTKPYCFRKHMEEHTAKPKIPKFYNCEFPECRRTFIKPHLFRKHMKVHTAKGSQLCKQLAARPSSTTHSKKELSKPSQPTLDYSSEFTYNQQRGLDTMLLEQTTGLFGGEDQFNHLCRVDQQSHDYPSAQSQFYTQHYTNIDFGGFFPTYQKPVHHTTWSSTGHGWTYSPVLGAYNFEEQICEHACGDLAVYDQIDTSIQRLQWHADGSSHGIRGDEMGVVSQGAVLLNNCIGGYA
ncbi:hypothetical protein G7Y89_g2734 [Cudoniella acicularis]|uniref:C2H2-type domain-containing protein n=1 Tax=Cudoniella acicularis TaxID=354080 RepID=A0A8H4W5V5_9HELO|nr:hypothetical protein G7Y89_g2734 [Cudoniella acicularis]